MSAWAAAAGAFVTFAFALPLPSTSAQTASSGEADFTEWAGRAARPLPSEQIIPGQVEWIARLASNASVLGIGESAHDVHNFLALRILITQRLIEQGRVSAVVMETGFAEAAQIDAWLAGRTSVAPDLASVLSFDFGREAELNQAFQWIRAYNARRAPDKQVHFYGADLPADGGGSMEPALAPVWLYLERVDPDFARNAKPRIEPIAHQLDTRGYDIVGRYAGLKSASRDSLHRALDEVATRFVSGKQKYVSRSSVAEFEWAQRLVEIARQTEHAVRIGWNEPTNPRDSAMAANIRWIARREGGRGLIVAWAHNLHVARVPIGGPIFAERGPAVKSMGQYLEKSFGDGYVAIGTAFRTGGPDTSQVPNSLSVDAALSNAKNPRFGIDLKSAPTQGPVAVWLRQSHLMRAENGYVTVRPRQAFDALLFVDRVRPADHLANSSVP
jgi:erythromycin esterase